MQFIKGAVVVGIATSFCLAQALGISGTVTDSVSGAAISGAAVSLVHCGLATGTDANGAFILTRPSTTAVIGRTSKIVAPAVSVVSAQGEIRLSLQEAARVTVKTYSVNGKQINSMERTLSSGDHCIIPTRTSSGIYLYQVVVNGQAYLLQQANVEGRAYTKAVVSGSHGRLAKNTASFAALFPDTVAVSKSGYATKRVGVADSVASGLAIKLWTATASSAVCGNYYCEVNAGENSLTCPHDCGASPAGGPVCGNGWPEPGETCQTCPQDCYPCPRTLVPSSGHGSRVALAHPARNVGESLPAGFTQIGTSDDLASVISWHSGNYWLTPGIHTVTGDVVCASNTVICGAPGAIIDGGGNAKAITLGDGQNHYHNLTVRNLIIQNFGNYDQYAAVQSNFSDAQGGLLIEDVEFRNNRSWGGWLGVNSIARRVWAHNNGEGGIKACGTFGPTDTCIVEDCELDSNNLRNTTVGEAGGFKGTSMARNITFRRNYTHDNLWSGGFWTDYCGTGNLVEDCTMEDQEAVIIEMTPNVEISHCTIAASDAHLTPTGYMDGAVYAYNAENLLVHNCLMHGGVVSFAKYRGSNTDIAPTIEIRMIGMKVTDNDFTLPDSACVGTRLDANPEAENVPPRAPNSLAPPSSPLPVWWEAMIWDATSNTWDRNVYHGNMMFLWGWADPSYKDPGLYPHYTLTWAQWQSHGEDLNSAIVSP